MRRGTKIQLTSLLGLAAASYALYVEMKMDVNPDYEAACDLGSFASCTKVTIVNVYDTDSCHSCPPVHERHTDSCNS